MANAYTSLKRVMMVREGSMRGRPALTSTTKAKEFVLKYWRENPACDQERFVVINLDTKHKALSIVTVSVGTLNVSLVHPREVFKSAILEGAAAVIFTHNHPSGDPDPSVDDWETDKRLHEAGDLLGITVLDHVIYGDGTLNCISLREESR